MSKHTPGKWIDCGYAKNAVSAKTPNRRIESADGKLIGRIVGNPDGNYEIGYANASLIVKAVKCHEELVAALKIAKERLEDLYSWDVGQRFCGHCGSSAARSHKEKCPITVITAAIAKATEETP